MNRIDSLERTLSSATETALAAKHGVANLETLAQSLTVDNKELRDELKSISTRLDLVIETSDSRTGMAKGEITRLKADVESLCPRVRLLEDEEAGLRAGSRALEMKCAALMRDQAVIIADVKDKILKERKQILKQEPSRESTEWPRNPDRLGMYKFIWHSNLS
jgi:chromosome segregation ATPase